MRWFKQVAYQGVWLSLLMTPAIVSGAQQASAPSSVPEVETSQHTPDEFAGAWAYNAAESVNAATGKPEQAPRSATRGGGGRGTGTTAPPSGRARGGDGGAGGGFGSVGSGFGGSQVGQVGPTPEMARASRDLSRDLMEIPESLTIAVSPASITIVDDLERKRTYPTDGRKQKYQLGASSFDARVEWKDSQLRKDIDGSFGFKMTETYFLSPDGSRLFVILRVGEVRKNVPPVGANRVYDRVVRRAPLRSRAPSTQHPARSTAMFSRILVIVLAFVVAALQVWRGAMVEASGLLGLGTGLLILRLAGRQSPLRQLAWLGFAVTASAVVLVLMRMRG